VVFWVVTPRCLVGAYQRFGGAYRLQIQSRMEAICCYGTFVTTYNITRRHSSEVHSRHLQRCGISVSKLLSIISYSEDLYTNNNFVQIKM
jgi:hypothetical protein